MSGKLGGALEPAPVLPAQQRTLNPIHLVTGSISGAISRTLTNPLERLKVLKQVSIGEYAGKSTLECFRYMWKVEGFYGFFKGNGVNVVRVAPFSAFEFFFYEFYKQNIFGGQPTSPNLSKLVCGGLTGMTASTLTYPLDLIRTKLSIQVTNVDGTKPSIWWTGKKIVREGGSVLALYKGLPSTLFVSHLSIDRSIFSSKSYQILFTRVLRHTSASKWLHSTSSRRFWELIEATPTSRS